MTKIGKRYWLETDHFFNESYTTNTPPNSNSKDKSRLSRFEIYASQKSFCNKPSLLHTTQYPDLFVSYTEGFDINTGERKPSILPQNEQFNQYSSEYHKLIGKLIEDKDKKYLFPPLNSTNNFATIDYETQINTKIDYAIIKFSKPWLFQN